ncbi:potassium-transporting ATPase subunit KdpA [Uliginosibacterium sp. 31-12]|uniref:potassium-transporting ATPase subunit KdpA n=1 Tax=Uliginosibacterium sp. 31-12 TaxID=3062781 RepID=UPI0026E3B726|nr:potassium-transporting ATPase subunit KdpA [Uliginosibacterium sp. 31-12]MDO6385427.1 potassium-transporting ATPase subunit KdpA [Uliginosibacterium sp. 31-12]
MNHSSVLQVGLYLLILFLLAWPLGRYLADLFEGRVAERCPRLAAVAGRFYRLCGVRAEQDMSWWRYALALLVFNAIGVLVVYALQRLQVWLPLNPAGMAAVEPGSAFNTAISFVTNTNWQGYSGEATMSHLTQMLGLAVQNFLSAATGLAVAIALVRGFARRSVAGIGNAWVDLTRATVGVLLPLSTVMAVFLVAQGVVQNFSGPTEVMLLQPVEYSQPKLGADGQPLKDAAGQVVTETVTAKAQSLPMGPVASQEAIKMVGTNGGGFFNANSAHPYENPTPLANLVQILAIFLIPAALCFTLGHMVGDIRQGLAILGAMTLVFLVMVAITIWAEGHANPLLTALGMDGSGGNLEGKDVRFGSLQSALFAVITTAASCGAVNAMHDSFMPLGGLVPMWLIQLGEVVFGGVGAGLYGMLVFAIEAVFLAGLMIGRTPEYLGKKIESYEMKMVAVVILATPLLILGGTAISVLATAGVSSMANPGAHGFSEVLYAFSSAANNNGSAFAGLSANTPFYNLMLGLVMWFGRFTVIVPVLAIAGRLAAKPRLVVTAGTLPTHGPLFIVLLIGTVVLVGALTYLPALALGPIVEHLNLFH